MVYYRCRDILTNRFRIYLDMYSCMPYGIIVEELTTVPYPLFHRRCVYSRWLSGARGDRNGCRVNPETRKKVYLLAQSYMPAQQIHILVNPANSLLSPWYELSSRQPVNSIRLNGVLKERFETVYK